MSESENFSSIAVIGMGVMGKGITQLLVGKGVNTILIGRDTNRFATVQEEIVTEINHLLKLNKLVQAEADAGIKNLKITQNLSEISQCDLIIEAITEDFPAKTALFKTLAKTLAPAAAIATNTSSLPISKLAAEGGLEKRLFGLHFMYPVPLSHMVELVTYEKVAAEHINKAKNFAKSLGLSVIQVEDSPGFIVNRLLMPLLAEAARVLESGIATAADIDQAMRLACGHPIGPLALADMIGLDIVLAELNQLDNELGLRYAPAENLRQLVTDGHLGRKTGKGFYDYQPKN